jgi:DNA-binding NarL/FixJ family response regulator
MHLVAAPRTAGLIARDAELDRALHSLRFSGGVMITGEAGVGKTALAAAVAERLSTPPVGWVVATAASRSIPLGALGNLLPADLTAIHPALIAQHVDTRLRELSRAGSRSTAAPVLVVDDAQLLDAQSAAILLSLVAARSLRLVLTMRTGGAPSDAVTALWKENLVDRLDLMPLSHRASRTLLEGLLGGPVAGGTVEMLWASSHGNPLYLSELARYGAEHGLLVSKAGVWWWLSGCDASRGAFEGGSALTLGTDGTVMPPRLGELLMRRIGAVSDQGREAVEFLALGEPLPYETLSALVGEDAILELDERGIVTSDEREGVLLLRFAHPLLHTVAEAGLSATRRRSLANRLRSAPASHVDIVRRASWEDLGSEQPNVDLLLAAADAVLLNDAPAAVRLAGRAHRSGGGVAAAAMLAAAQSEYGRPDLARRTLASAAGTATSPAEQYALLHQEFCLALWGERDPARAAAVLARQREQLPPSFRNKILGQEAIRTLFSGGGLTVLPLAHQLLDSDPSPSDRIRALTALTGALAFADRGTEAIRAGQELLGALADERVSAPQVGLAYALVAATGVLYGAQYRLPRSVGLLGRWPAPPAQLDPGAAAVSPRPALEGAADIGWPMLVGFRRHLAGDLAGAEAALREAYVQQQSGEGLFHSEATAELIVVLSELGQVEEAGEILRNHPPDEVAIIPGLRAWAQAAVHAASGLHRRAAESAIVAARAAAAAGVSAMAMTYLTDAARYGDPRAAAAAMAELGLPQDSQVQRVRAADISARVSRSPAVLLEAAETQLLAGFKRHAAELAELARRADGSGGFERRAAAVLRQARERLGQHAGSPTALAASPLTQRETEVARMASRGLSDRDIADELVVSIRTVQSHLASTYRKLGIGSRTELGVLYA